MAVAAIDPAALARFEAEARADVAAAWSQAESDPFPAPEALLGRVYGSRR